VEQTSGESAWRGRVVLVTGARGFIASHLCQRLVREGALVYGVSRASAPTASSDVQWVCADFAEASAAGLAFRKTRPDIVFHLAGHVTGSQDIANVDPTLLQNLESTVRVMTAAVETGRPRVVLAASMQEPRVDEPAAVPCSPYAASKWACSAYARMFHALYGLPVTIAKPFMVYGPGQWDLHKLLPYVIVSLLRGEIPNIGTGVRELDWVYVDDVVDGLLAAADSPCTDASPIDLGSGQLTSVKRTVELVRDLLDSKLTVQFGAVADRPLERAHAARVEETRRSIGWSTTTSLETGLRQTIEWYRAQLAVGSL
jgi:nucleoside-diphosphate-sugar epimerase